MKAEDAPIGYWLKHVDRLIEDAVDRVLADHRLTRRHWQVLNGLNGGPATAEEIGALPFWTAGPLSPDEAIGDLIARGWCSRTDDGRYALTLDGRSALAALARRVGDVRARTARGITREEYVALVRTLRRMAENLESAA
jgi:hypothetical protein